MKGTPKSHNHPLTVEYICCPDHVYEMCSFFQKQGRDEEVIFVLLSLTDLLNTTYLLDTSEQAQHRKKALITYANEFALYCGNSETLDIATSLLSVAETLLGALQVDEEAEGLKATTLLNIAFLHYKEGNAQKALGVLEEAEKLESRRKDVVGLATVKISMSSVLIHLENFEEGLARAQQALHLLEEEQQRTRDYPPQRFRGLLIAAKLSITSASEHLNEGRNTSQLLDLKTSLIECVEAKAQLQESGVKMREYDGSPIQPIVRSTHRKTTASSNMAEDFRSFCERVQGWEKDKAIENPSFLTIREPKDDFPPPLSKTESVHDTPKDTPKTPAKLTPPSPRERRIALETSMTQNRGSEDSAVIAFVRARRTQKPTQKLLFRMPNSQLPQIPTRSAAYKSTFLSLFRLKSRPIDGKSLLLRFFGGRNESVRSQKLVENTLFIVHCTFTPGKVVFAAASNKGGNPPDEALSLEELTSVMDFFYLDEVAPKYIRSGLLISRVDFAQFCLFPFLQIAAPGQRISRRIEFWSYAPGLIPGQHRVVLGKRRRVAVHQIGECMLRVVLTEVCNCPKAETDISFEVKIDTELKSTYGILWEASSELHLLKPEFLQLLDPVFREITADANQSESIVLRRVLMSGEYSDLVLTRVVDDRKNRMWLCTSTKVKETSHALETISVPYSFLISKFGVLPKHLSREEAELLAGFVLDSLVVRVLNPSGTGESLVYMTPVEEIVGWRGMALHFGEYVPLTFTLIGIKSRVIGVRGTVWNVKRTLESGCLWYVESNNYRKQPESASSQGKKKKKLEIEDRLSEIAEHETTLISQLADGGWATLSKSISLGSSATPELSIHSPDGSHQFISRLELFLKPLSSD